MTWVFFATPLAWRWYAVVGSPGTYLAGLAASFVWLKAHGAPVVGLAPES